MSVKLSKEPFHHAEELRFVTCTDCLAAVDRRFAEARAALSAARQEGYEAGKADAPREAVICFSVGDAGREKCLCGAERTSCNSWDMVNCADCFRSRLRAVEEALRAEQSSNKRSKPWYNQDSGSASRQRPEPWANPGSEG